MVVKIEHAENSVDENMEQDSEVIKYIRDQRHDFMNDIQVIWGYLQLNRPEDARSYITGMNHRLDIYSYIFNLENPTLSLFLYNHIHKAQKLGLTVDFDTELDKLSKDAFFQCYFEKLNVMDYLFEEVMKKAMENKGDSTIYIDIYKEDERLFIAFSNNCNDDCECIQNNVDACLDIRTRNAMEQARKAGIETCCTVSGMNIICKVCFDYEEG
jgi:Signal transduction histidine kinase regulating citrate/malate metabolism